MDAGERHQAAEGGGGDTIPANDRAGCVACGETLRAITGGGGMTAQTAQHKPTQRGSVAHAQICLA